MTAIHGERVVSLRDRRDFFAAANAALEVDPTHSAVLTIDMHRGHLDPELATMPVLPGAHSIVDRSARLLADTRPAGLATLHSVTVRRDIEAASSNPFQRMLAMTRQSVAPDVEINPRRHNLEGSLQCELMPQLGPDESDFVLANKKQLSAFHATDLDQLLGLLEIRLLFLLGVGTNTCILSTALDASNRGYGVVVVEDCTTSLNGEDLHLFGLENVRRTIGWVLKSSEVTSLLSAHQNEGEKYGAGDRGGASSGERHHVQHNDADGKEEDVKR